MDYKTKYLNLHHGGRKTNSDINLKITNFNNNIKFEIGSIVVIEFQHPQQNFNAIYLIKDISKNYGYILECIVEDRSIIYKEITILNDGNIIINSLKGKNNGTLFNSAKILRYIQSINY